MRFKKILSIALSLCFISTIIFSSNVNAATATFVVDGHIEYKIIIGEKIKLYIINDNNVKWTSSNKKIATISKKGVVTGKKGGTVTITAKTKKTKYKCTVYVWTGKQEIVYENDKSKSKPKDRYSLVDEDITTPSPKENESDLDGIHYNDDDNDLTMNSNTDDSNIKNNINSTSNSNTNNASKSEWVSSSTLDSIYSITTIWMGDYIWIINDETEEKYELTNSPTSTFDTNIIYEGLCNGYTIHFKYDIKQNEIVYKYSDLINAKLI